ncbi:putative quinone-oxidoreductase homolog chloroplastic [Phtheirospermum japonicum]|uniref:Putative quinone-oxidoreductase homolog chloroplastic n=1 Tax=Phtheirospermum japonicum TaxID=374723 RepID=A0A830C374_9LAMI|nr:putative quinone-oxidoreductase homolog chloroplastic [Phtheirospermum japonicum]
MAGKLMRAIVFGGGSVGGVVGLKHVQVPIPSPSKDEVLIKLEAISLNPVDWKIHKLRVMLRPFIARNSPLIPSTDVAGEVVEIGSEVKKFKPGDKVVAILNTLTGGGLSEYAAAKEIMTVSRPDEVSDAEGSGLPIAGLTAHIALTKISGIKLDKTGPEKNILITAASGGVGLYAVQLAKLGNNHVTATCGARNIDFLKSLGADEVLDYRTPQGSSLTSPSGKKYDAVIHCGPAVAWSIFEKNLSENGIVVDLTPGPAAMWTYAVKKITRSNKKLVPFILSPSGDHSLKYLVELVRDGKIKTIIDSKHSLSRCEEAWRKSIEGHATGKIIVEP